MPRSGDRNNRKCSLRARERHAKRVKNTQPIQRAASQEELQRLKWSPTELKGRRKTDPQKARIAVRLPRQAQ
jgi:hypothetical protein